MQDLARQPTTSLFAELSIATGAVVCKWHRATELLDFLKRIDAEMPAGKDTADQKLAGTPSA